MRLVFIHGWAFDKNLWNAVSAALPDMPSIRVELGFLGAPQEIPEMTSEDILIGHSLGFQWGIAHYQGWKKWIAINSFARFAGSVEEGYCVPISALRALKQNLLRDAHRTITAFRKNIGCRDKVSDVDEARLQEGLDWLQGLDVAYDLAHMSADGLVLASGKDPLVPLSASEFLASRKPAAQISMREEGGHLLPVTDPLWCAEHIRKFIV